MSRTIMIVDDEPMITTTLATLVRLMMRQDVTVYNDPREALLSDKLRDGGIDLILSDFLMPGMNGVEFLRQARDIAPSVVAVMLTGYADKENAIRSINEVGLYYYIEKPWDNASLVRILQNGLEKREMEENDVRQRRELEDSNRTIERLYSRLQQDFTTEREQAKDILVTLANLIEAKDSYTDEHTFRVSEGCRLIGRRIGLTPEQVDSLAIAGALHDIGKVGTPEHILNKPGKLTPEEFDLIRQHPIKGETILKPLSSLHDILDPVRHHHEKLNGSGYPDGLRGDAVSQEARILAVMDIFDALHTSRPYRAQLPLDKTRAILSEESERGELDTRVVEALFAVIDSGEADSLLASMN